MDFNDYQSRTNDTATYPNNGEGADVAVDYALFGLLGEAGELANKWKKHYRDGVSRDDLREGMLDELGDVLWYAARLAMELDASLGDVANMNLNKLQSRSRRGVVKGNGDNR